MSDPVSDPSRLTVCRGCCCGTAEKHPDVDHVGQLRRLREAVGPHDVTVANCLSSCGSSNVVVVRPARGTAAKPVRLGGVLTDAVVDRILDWVAEGGPGRAAMPAGLAPHVIHRPTAVAAGDDGEAADLSYADQQEHTSRDNLPDNLVSNAQDQSAAHVVYPRSQQTPS